MQWIVESHVHLRLRNDQGACTLFSETMLLQHET